MAQVQSCGGDTTWGHPARAWRSCLFALMPVATPPSRPDCCIRQETRRTKSLADLTVGVYRTTFSYDSDAESGGDSDAHLDLRRRPLFSLVCRGSTHCYWVWMRRPLVVAYRSSLQAMPSVNALPARSACVLLVPGPRIVARSRASISSGRSQLPGAGLGAEVRGGSEARGLAAP